MTRELTYQDLIDMGYKLSDTKYERGYISRRVAISRQIIKLARGKRKGELYTQIPSYTSSQYCVRQYFTHDDSELHEHVLAKYFNSNKEE